MSGRWVGFVTRLCIAGILVGIIFMIQPFVFELFKIGFLLLLAATILYTVVSHFPEKSSAAANTAITEEVPISLGVPDSSRPV